MVLGFKFKVVVIQVKCSLKISNRLLLSETMAAFSEIIILLEKFHLSEKNGLIALQKFLLSDPPYFCEIIFLLEKFPLSEKYDLIAL